MASKLNIFMSLALVFATFTVSMAGDTDILTDFIVPATVGGPIDGNFFTFTGFRALIGAPFPPTFKVSKASLAEFPALNGQSVSYAFLQFAAGAVNPPHTHPRASELLFVLMGSLQVGFVDTTNKLFTQTLQQGDIFVFPKGLVHFQFNSDAKNPALAVSGFGSASAGTVSVPNTVSIPRLMTRFWLCRSKLTFPPFRRSKLGFMADSRPDYVPSGNLIT